MFRVERDACELAPALSIARRKKEGIEEAKAFLCQKMLDIRVPKDDPAFAGLLSHHDETIESVGDEIWDLANPFRHGVVRGRGRVDGVGIVTHRLAERIFDLVALYCSRHPQKAKAAIDFTLDDSTETLALIEQLNGPVPAETLDELGAYFLERLERKEIESMASAVCDALNDHRSFADAYWDDYFKVKGEDNIKEGEGKTERKPGSAVRRARRKRLYESLMKRFSP